MDTSVLLRIGNKIPMEGVTETKLGTEMEERTVQTLSYPVIHLIYNIIFKIIYLYVQAQENSGTIYPKGLY